ncbi:histidine phosphatase family protein [Bradyrhizobium sp. 190]|uniref:histidine phosphatase family protein n=1 Tax=Bradyrhizobium sp. 190 TaxID=2782658 RepID=UPI0027DEF0C5|nr:histidine phosphatase family protein [Bradyrhizobium sp. 190]MCK1515125.1 histidine phosphatase family protein [Bradyrhizobium sp. 190]
MQGETFLWLVRHAVVDCPGGTIHPSDAPADLSDRTHLEAVRRCLPQNALSYASPSQRTLDTARALRFDPISVPEFMEQNFGDWTASATSPLPAPHGKRPSS